jgi:SPP1 family predicted phage head-tail adaptor
MRTGLLKDSIKIQRKTVTETEYAGRKIKYRDYITTRASVVHVGGGKGIVAGEVCTSYTVRFTLHSYHKIEPDMIIIHEGVRYRILDINKQLSQQRIIITGEIINE